ncbi:STAS domain-containing protein, partial [Gemmatimonas sp.]|uniref:STAS domain-containing protein n=1 Tax=Gemmatimonas sp. TaxID=1962908 RepID=UPI00391A9590
MSFTLEHTDHALIVTIEGHLVVTNRQEFKQAILDAVAQGAMLIVVDFTVSGYIDSSGLGALVSL